MHESVSVEITFSYWTAYKATLQVLFRSPVRMLISALFPLAGLYLLYVWEKYQHPLSYYEYFLLFLCFLFTPMITAISLYFARRRNPLSVGPFTYIFDAAGIHATGAAFESTIRWVAVRKVVETKTFILIYIAPARAIALPMTQLRAAGMLERVRQVINDNQQVKNP